MGNDADIYRRFLEGDESGFDEILDLYQHKLIFFINRYVHDLTVAEDIAEDTFLELLIHKRRYNFKTSLKTYLFAIGRNKAINYLKRQKKLVQVDMDMVDFEKHDNDICESIIENIMNEEKKHSIMNAIKNLKNDYRDVIYLIYFENMSYMEAGKIMRKSRKQIENLVYRARNALKVTLAKEGLEI